MLWNPPNVFIYDRDQYIYWHFSRTCIFIARLQIKNKTRIWMGNINLSKRRQALLLEFHNFLSNVLVSAIFLKEQVTYLKTLLKHSRVEKTYTMSTSHFISMRRVHLLWLWKWFALLLLLLLFLFLLLFYLSGFSSQKLTIHRTAGERRGPSFITLYYFHPLTKICMFACEMTITYF